MMKTRWNACYALVNTLQNPILSPSHASWGPDLFSTLLSVITHCKNFKVRINATLALSQCAARANYGAHFAKIYSTVLILLCDVPGAPTGGNMSGYTDKLRLQLLLLLCHLLQLHETGDQDTMTSSLPQPHFHPGMVAQCSAISTAHTLTDAERGAVERAREVCHQCQFTLIHKMLSPRALPSDTEAFVTSDITRNIASDLDISKIIWDN